MDSLSQFLMLIKQNVVLWSIISNTSINVAGLEQYNYKKFDDYSILFKNFKFNDQHTFEKIDIDIWDDYISVRFSTNDPSYYDKSFGIDVKPVVKPKGYEVKWLDDVCFENEKVGTSMMYDYLPVIDGETFSYSISLNFDRKDSWLWHIPLADNASAASHLDNRYIDNMPEFLSLVKQNKVLWSILSTNSTNAEGLENCTYRKGRRVIELKNFELDKQHLFESGTIMFDDDQIIIVLPTNDSSYYQYSFGQPATIVSKGNIVTAKELGQFTIDGKQAEIGVEHYNSSVRGESYAIFLRFRRESL